MYKEPKQSLGQTSYVRKRNSLVNKGQDMFGCEQYGRILLASIGMGTHTNMFSFGGRLLPDYGTCDVGLYNSMAPVM